MSRGRYGRFELTAEEHDAVNRLIFDVLLFQGPPPLNAHGMRGLSRDQQSESYQSWARGGRAWRALHQGGTGQLAVVCWYQHIHRPGSHEWRPAKIIPAFVEAALACGAPTPSGMEEPR